MSKSEVLVLRSSTATAMPSSAPAEAPVELDMSIKRSARLVSLFISRVPENLTELEAAVSTRDANLARDKAHKLKGSCLAVGAELMSNEAEALQIEAKNGDLDKAKERCDRLWRQYARVKELLSEAPCASPLENLTSEE